MNRNDTSELVVGFRGGKGKRVKPKPRISNYELHIQGQYDQETLKEKQFRG